jgi:hypothetical protein
VDVDGGLVFYAGVEPAEFEGLYDDDAGVKAGLDEGYR